MRTKGLGKPLADGPTDSVNTQAVKDALHINPTVAKKLKAVRGVAEAV